MTRQRALWSRIGVLQEATQQANRARRNKKSEKRQRTERITVRLLPSEQAALVAEAREAHISVSELVRSSALRQCRNRGTAMDQTAAERKAERSE
jgi:hypothetical protein